MNKLSKIFAAFFTIISIITLVACAASTNDVTTNNTCQDATWIIIQEPTCITDGIREFRCHDGTVLKTEVIPFLGHETAVWVIVLEPTFITEGLRELRCPRCDDVLASEIIPVLIHDFQLVSYLDPTCTEEGYRLYVCSVDSTYTNRVVVPALGHSEGAWVTVLEPTFTIEGLKELRCLRCNTVLDTEVIPVLIHDFQLASYLNPTCTEAGYRLYVCSVDPSYTNRVVVPALGHSEGAWVTVLEPTFTTEGLKELRCLRCNTVLDTEVIPVLIHDFQLVSYLNPTCTEAGYRLYICAVDPSYTNKVILPALGHLEGVWLIVLAPTCTENGLRELRCPRSETVLDSEILPAIGHNFQLSRIVEPTCTLAGYRLYVCLNDTNHTNKIILPALGHLEGVWIIVLAPTCTENGLRELRCPRSKTVLDSEILPAIGHNFSEWSFFAAATFSRPETHRRTCSNCQTIESKFVATELFLGTTSDAQLVSTPGAWFMLTLAQETTIQLGWLLNSGFSANIEAYLSSFDFSRSRMITSSNRRLGVGTLDAGTYWVQLVSFSGVQDLSVRVDDFSLLVNNSITLDQLSSNLTVDNIGLWYRLELTQQTQVQISAFLHQGFGFGTNASLFSVNDLGVAIVQTGPFVTNVSSLSAGIYYIRFYNEFGGMASGNLLLTNVTKALTNAQLITFGVQTAFMDLDTAGVWFRLELSRETNVRFRFHEVINHLGVSAHLNDNNLTRFMTHNHNGGITHSATLPAGTIFINLRLNGTIGSVNGALTIEDLTNTLNVAPNLQIGVSSGNFTVNRSGMWFRLVVTEETRIRIAITTVSGSSLTNSIFTNNNLYNSIIASQGIFTLDAGTHYVFFGSHLSQGATGSFIITLA